MADYAFVRNGFEYKEVSRQWAKEAYESGATVFVCACNLRPGFPWHPESDICKRYDNFSFESAFYIPTKTNEYKLHGGSE